VDKVTKRQRSRNMAAVRGRDTAPELLVRSCLHRLGLRFRDTGLPGSPDIVLKRHGAVVLVHGCFWHGHDCPRGRPPTTREEFWLPKLARNRARDRQQVYSLRALGWRVLVVWECETKDETRLNRRLRRWFRLAQPPAAAVRTKP
jgi:DNA mismatch endonuclease, patch repair protein